MSALYKRYLPYSKVLPKRNGRSYAWKYFGFPADENGTVLSTDIAICTVCKSPVLSKGSNTTNLLSHLKIRHPLKYSEIDKSSTVSQVVVDPDEPQMNQEIGHPITESSEPSVKQEKIMRDFQPLDNHSTERYTDSVAKYLALTMQPYKTVEQKPFMDMLKVFNPRYELPGRKHFSTVAIPKLFNDAKEKIQQELAKRSDSPVAITTDCWTSISNIPYISVTAHFISLDWTLKSICLSCAHFEEDHNYKNVIEVLNNILSDWDIDIETIAACTTDNGTDVVKAIQEMKINHITCFGHSINIGINHALELPDLKKAVTKVKKLQNTIAHSWKMRRDLSTAQILLEQDVKSLPSACPTSWWSTLKLIKRFLENQIPVCKMIVDHHPDKKHLLLEVNEIEVLDSFVSATNLLENMAETLSGEDYITSSCILPLYGQIKKLLVSKDDNQLTDDIKENILRALTKYEIEPLASILKLSSLCDPRFRLRYIESKEEVKKIALDKMIAIYKTIGDNDKCTQKYETKQNQEKSTKEKSISQFFPDADECEETDSLPSIQAELELNNYLAMPKVDFDHNPLQWWKLHHSSFPALSKIAKYYLAIQATSVPSDRIFSTGGNIIDKQKDSLLPKNAEMRIFLAYNKEYVE